MKKTLLSTQTKIFFFLLLGTNISMALELKEEILNQYGTYMYSFGFFTFLVIFFLLYWALHYKNRLKQSELLLIEQQNDIEGLQKLNHENELERLKKELEMEKKILELQHTLETVEEKEKKGLKNQVVRKIEEYQNRRNQRLKRLDIEA